MRPPIASEPFLMPVQVEAWFSGLPSVLGPSFLFAVTPFPLTVPRPVPLLSVRALPEAAPTAPVRPEVGQLPSAARTARGAPADPGAPAGKAAAEVARHPEDLVKTPVTTTPQVNAKRVVMS